jgi:hypothetical protein
MPAMITTQQGTILRVLRTAQTDTATVQVMSARKIQIAAGAIGRKITPEEFRRAIAATIRSGKVIAVTGYQALYLGAETPYGNDIAPGGVYYAMAEAVEAAVHSNAGTAQHLAGAINATTEDET